MSPPTSTAVDWNAWQEAITKWARDASGLQVIWAKQAENAPQVRKPYVLLDVVSLKRRGYDGVSLTSEGVDVVATTYGIRQIVLNVQVVANAKGLLADSAYAWAEELQNGLYAEPGLRALVAVGLGISDVGQVRDLSAIEQSQYVSRATFDVVLEGAAVKARAWTAPTVGRIVGSVDIEGNSTPELTFDVEDE